MRAQEVENKRHRVSRRGREEAEEKGRAKAQGGSTEEVENTRGTEIQEETENK